MDRLEGRVALITGAASGIGLGLAEALGSAGMRLALLDVDADALGEAERRLGDAGHAVLSLAADVADAGAMRRAVSAVVAAFGRLDLLCNNAGVALEGPVETWTDEGWRWVLEVNLMGVVNGVRAALPQMRRAGGGHILNTASMGGLSGAAFHGQYAASKFAVVGLSQSLRDELAPDGVGVSVLCPGFIRSRIASSARNAPAALRERQAWLMREGFSGPAADFFRLVEARVATGMDAREVGEIALAGIRENAFYILTETEFLGGLERRRRALDRAIETVAARAAPADGAHHG